MTIGSGVGLDCTSLYGHTLCDPVSLNAEETTIKILVNYLKVDILWLCSLFRCRLLLYTRSCMLIVCLSAMVYYTVGQYADLAACRIVWCLHYTSQVTFK